MRTKHTIEIEVEWDYTNMTDWRHRIHYSNGDQIVVSDEWLAARGITRPKQQPTPGVWYKINDPAIEMPAGKQEVLVRGGEGPMSVIAFAIRRRDRTEFMVVPE